MTQINQEKTYKYLRIVFILSILIVLGGFIFDVLHMRGKIVSENVALERWAILITLFGIFGSLKYLRPQIIEVDFDMINSGIKIYVRKYFVRLVALLSIYAFNLINFTITGSRNFLFLAFITIFAMFLCAPSKKQVEIKSNNI